MNEADLKPFPLLSEMREEDREALVELLEEQSVSARVPLFREGSEAEGLVLVARGEVRVESRRCEETFTAGPGTCLGAVSLLLVGPRECSAIAESPVVYYLLPRTSFRRLMDDSPLTACRLAEAIAIDLAGSVREGLDEIAASR